MFIYLHSSALNGIEITININAIATAVSKENKSIISFIGEDSVMLVNESYDEVKALINKALNMEAHYG